MHIRRYLLPAVMLGSLLTIGAGCISFNSGPANNAGQDGGVYKSADKGDNWAQKTAIATTTGDKRSISSVWMPPAICTSWNMVAAAFAK